MPLGESRKSQRTTGQFRGVIAGYLVLLRVPVFTGALLLALPLLSFFTGARSLLRGLFDLTALSLFVVTLTALAVAGAATMNGSVVLLHAYQRFHVGTGALSLSNTSWILIMFLLGLPVIVASVAFSITQKHPTGRCILAAVSGTSLALGFSYLLIQHAPTLAGSFKVALRPLEEWMARTNLFNGYVDLTPGGTDPLVDHLRASAAFLSSLILYAIVGIYGYFQLGRRRTVPALCSALMLILMISWMLSAVTFFFDAWRIPTLLIVGIAGTLTAQSVASDHFYHLRRRTSGIPAPSPGATLGATNAPRVIVVAANGGGIQAAAWAAQVLYGLHQDCGERFDRALRMISSVSGGSVGSAFFIHWLSAATKGNQTVRPPNEAAAESSLDEVAWGLAWTDFLRSLAPWILRRLLGRGRALERAWASNSAKSQASARAMDEPLSDWNHEVAAGKIPAQVMNATITETGERLLLATTGMGGGSIVGRARVDATELHTINGQELDTGIVTAARLSASFPYVTPASRSDGPGPQPHVVDGGYYDNYGMATMVEWLDAALTGITATVESVLVIQIRGVKIDPNLASRRFEKGRGWFYQAFAPVSTLVAVRGSGQIAHNDIELTLVRQKWAPKVKIDAVTFEFPKSDAPLSWHLTPREVEDVRVAWEKHMTGPRLRVKQFLGFPTT